MAEAAYASGKLASNVFVGLAVALSLGLGARVRDKSVAMERWETADTSTQDKLHIRQQRGESYRF